MNNYIKFLLIAAVPALIYIGLAAILTNVFGYGTLFGLAAFVGYGFTVYYLVQKNNNEDFEK